MLTPYRRVLAVPGALAFSVTGLVARLPISMVSLGIVILVSTRSGSYRLAGGVAAAYLVGHALLAIVQGRLADRLGQSRVLPWTVLVFTVSLSLLMWSVEAGLPSPVPHVLAAVGGAAQPQIGSCVRARWSHSLPDKGQLQTAFAIEAVVDEAVFVLGPILVTVLSTTLHPGAGLATAVVTGLVGTLALAAQRATEPPAHRAVGHRAGGVPMGWTVLGPLVLTGAAMGAVFGGVEVATVAFAEELGAKAVSGPLLGMFALGSLLAGFVSGMVSWRAPNAARFRRGTLALAVALVPLPFVGGFVLLGVVLFVAGFSIAPTLIAMVAWVEETVPARRLTEGISIVTTGIGLGVAPGAAVVGSVIDRHGASASYWVPVVAAWLAAGVACATLLLPEGRSVVSRTSSR
jgi:MFS family permease